MGKNAIFERAVRFMAHEVMCGVQADLQLDPALASVLILHCGGCGAGMPLHAERDEHRQTGASVLTDGL
jgi:hypothetical protein